MAFVHRYVMKQRWILSRVALVFAFSVFVVVTCGAYQSAPARRNTPANAAPYDARKAPAANDWTAEMAKNPEMWSELGKLFPRRRKEAKWPGSGERARFCHGWTMAQKSTWHSRTMAKR